jgi:hypothetical protein
MQDPAPLDRLSLDAPEPPREPEWTRREKDGLSAALSLAVLGVGGLWIFAERIDRPWARPLIFLSVLAASLGPALAALLLVAPRRTALRARHFVAGVVAAWACIELAGAARRMGLAADSGAFRAGWAPIAEELSKALVLAAMMTATDRDNDRRAIASAGVAVGGWLRVSRERRVLRHGSDGRRALARVAGAARGAAGVRAHALRRDVRDHPRPIGDSRARARAARAALLAGRAGARDARACWIQRDPVGGSLGRSVGDRAVRHRMGVAGPARDVGHLAPCAVDVARRSLPRYEGLARGRRRAVDRSRRRGARRGAARVVGDSAGRRAVPRRCVLVVRARDGGRARARDGAARRSRLRVAAARGRRAAVLLDGRSGAERDSARVSRGPPAAGQRRCSGRCCG